MHKHKKATRKDLVALNDILKVSKQVIQNYSEDYGFADILDRFNRKEYLNKGPISVCKTPYVLSLGGARSDVDLIITPSTLLKCLSKPNEWHHGHDLERDVFKYLILELRNPVLLLKGSKENTLVAVTDLKDRENKPVVVSVALNRQCNRCPVNQITSAYGKNNFNDYLRRQIEKGNLIAVNKNKANQMLLSAGLQLPLEETLISFDNSIAYTLDNVNSQNEKKLKKSAIFSFKKRKINLFPTLNASSKENFKKLNEYISKNDDIVEMIRFFEYAGPEIYNSALWHKFQQDKEYLDKSDMVLKLEALVSEARDIAADLEAEQPVKTPKQNHHYYISF